MNFVYGLILVESHGTYIYDGEKTIIIKSINLSHISNVPLLLIEHKDALGIIYLSAPIEINISQFNKLKNKHMITDEERKLWWPKYKKLYQYNIIKFHKFKYKFAVTYPQGPQVLVKPENIHFLLPKVYIGTSGFIYDHDNLNSVEINSTFYKTPSKKTCNNWQNDVDGKFVFSVKVSKYITHYNKLHNIENEWTKFYNGIKCLKIGCILFQFPEQFTCNETNYNNLSNLKNILPRNKKFAFEFRNTSWFDDQVKLIDLFNKNKNWSVVIYYMKNNGFIPSFNYITSKFAYIRLHGDEYKEQHSLYVLNKIKELIYTNTNLSEVYVYFNNTDSQTDDMNDAYHDAIRLKKLIGIV